MSPSKIKRLRTLALIVYEKISFSFEETGFIELLVNESKEEDFFEAIKPSN